MISSGTHVAQTRRGSLARCVGVIGIVAAWSAQPLPAQYQVRQNGRLFDANPLVGGGGYNYTRPISPLQSGNPYATGNVRYGLSLRSFSPIADPSAFQASLGTSALSEFRRDSVSVADRQTPLFGGRNVGQIYYDPALTAPTMGFLQGQYGTRWRQPQNILLPPSGEAGYAGSLLGQPLDPRLDRAQALRSRITGAAPRPTRSEAATIFGVQRFAETPVDAFGRAAPRPGQLWSGEQAADAGESVAGAIELPDLVPPFARPLEFDTPGIPSAAPLSTPLDMVLKGDVTGLILADRTGPGDRAEPTAPQGESAPGTGAGGMGAVGAPTMLDPSLLPGNDVFTDMQFALTLKRDPRAEWFRDMKAAVSRNTNLTPELQKFAELSLEQFVNSVLDQPLETFVGGGASSLNDELLKAESLMDIGQYYDAAARYEAAHLIDPLNPLPLIGKGHALLAAGEYLSAAVALVSGLERFPELVRFQVNLKVLIGGGEIVDIRRSDIMKQLNQREDPRLRFLLGYIEYHSGDRESGLANLEQAAAEAKVGSMIWRYPTMLRGGALPPPKLPLSVPTRPGVILEEPGAGSNGEGAPGSQP